LNARTIEEEQIKETPPTFHDLLIPEILKPLSFYVFLEFLEMCIQVLQPLVYSTSTSLGGVGFTPYTIGLVMGMWGFLNALVQLTLLGPTIRYFGPRKMIFISLMNYMIVISLYPVLGYFARRAGYADSRVWAVIMAQLTCMMTNSAAYSKCLFP
jgi:hypothetical protein